MTRWERTWAEAVLTAFVVEESPGLNVKKGEVDYLSTMRRMRSGGTKLAAFGVRVAVWMVATAPLWLLGRFVMFGTLGRAERTELLCRLLEHKSFAVRELTLLLKLTAAIALLGTASVRTRSHYDAPPPAASAPALQPSAAAEQARALPAATTAALVLSASTAQRSAELGDAPTSLQPSAALVLNASTAQRSAELATPTSAKKATVRLLVVDTQRARVVS